MKHLLSLAALCGIALLLSHPSQALTREEAALVLGREVLKPASAQAEIVAYMTAGPLSGYLVTPDEPGASSISVDTISGNPQWFALVDLHPCQLWNHEALYVFIDDATGFVTTYPAEGWPLLAPSADPADVAELDDNVGAAGPLTHFYPLLKQPSLRAASGNPAANVADYGDAPEDTVAYPTGPPVVGRFPVSYASPYSGANGAGGHALSNGDYVLGTTVSLEQDILDPADPDGQVNHVNGDSGERMFIAWFRSYNPDTALVLYDVTVDAGAPPATLYLNVNADLNRDGEWKKTAQFDEWGVKDQALTPSAGTTTFATPAFPIQNPASGNPAVQFWMRVLLTTDPALKHNDDYNGSGRYANGEVEDYCAYLRPCSAKITHPAPPPPPDDPVPDPPPPPEEPPGEPLGWSDIPVNYFALVVEGVDRHGHTAADEAADKMHRLLLGQGYDVTHLKGDSATPDAGRADDGNIDDWFANVKAKVKCQDKILVYFIAHGFKDDGLPGDVGKMRLRNAGKGDPGTYTGDDLLDALNSIPFCPAPTDWCDLNGHCCSLTVIVESCYSGLWQEHLEGEGRRIITTSSKDKPSYYGSDGTGGEYSDRYAECARDSAADLDGNGLTPDEAHNWAVPNLQRPQTPAMADATCDCTCPPPWWDCISDPYAGGEDMFLVHYPSFVTDLGEPIALTFVDGYDRSVPEPPLFDELIGIPLPPAELRYWDSYPPVIPNDWHWGYEVVFPLQERVFGFQVEFVNIPPEYPILFPLCIPEVDDEVLVSFFIIQVDIQADIIQIIDPENPSLPLFFGNFSQYPQNLASAAVPLIPSEAVRGNQPPPPSPPEAPDPVEIELVELSLHGEVAISWKGVEGVDAWTVERSSGDLNSWATAAGPIIQRAYVETGINPGEKVFWRVSPFSPPATTSSSSD